MGRRLRNPLGPPLRLSDVWTKWSEGPGRFFLGGQKKFGFVQIHLGSELNLPTYNNPNISRLWGGGMVLFGNLEVSPTKAIRIP